MDFPLATVPIQSSSEDDPRCRPLSYITDGVGLYEVLSVKRKPAMATQIEVENCRRPGNPILLLAEKVTAHFELVKPAPDEFEDLAA